MGQSIEPGGKPPKVLRHRMCDDGWISDVAREVASCDRSEWDPGLIQVVTREGHDMLAARGRIAEHVDADFPQWSYLLIVETPVSATLCLRGHQPLALMPGLLVEFDAHLRHRLIQKRREDTLWCPIDSHDRLDLDEAHSRMVRTFG